MTPVVRLSGVDKSFIRGGEPVVVLDGLDLRLAPGEVVIVRGRSGSGKTTLLNILAGWQTPDRGDVAWGVSDPADWNQVAVVPQSLGLLPELTLGENIGLPGRLAGDRDNVTELAGRLDIGHLLERWPTQASLGEQQRAAIGRALVRKPTLLLADEPSSHQDVDRLRLVWALLIDAARQGATVLAATHDADALSFADRILDLSEGRLVETDQPH